jgi:predicted transcriptional regulator
MEKTTVYLPSETHAALRALARRTGRPQAALIRDALERYVRDNDPQLPRSIGVAEHAPIHSDEVEDWLAVNYRPT